ncbi:MAG: metal ABC transporter ATP-binding protein [Candidatus Freyarchaeum deiterrae]
MESQTDYLLKVSNVSVELANQPILDNVSFTLKRGTTLAIVGPNGAGKTTLFRVLLNMVPHTGKIEWSGHVKIGYVPQILSVTDVPITVKEFLSIKSRSNQAGSLNSVGLDSKSILNKSLSVLSGGQLRRVLVAWAIIDKPNVLLFDEPTSGVDLGGEEAIYQTLKRLTKETEIALLLISHDVHIVREYSDYMLVLNKCVTFFGESKEIKNLDIQKLIFGEPVCLEREPDRNE